MRFSDLVRGASLRGTAAWLSPSSSLRLGRGIGTMIRRQNPASTTVVVGRSRGAAEAAVRDGLVAGLVASGLVVADLGIVESDRFTAALRRGPTPHAAGAALWPVVGGVLVAATGDSLGIMLFDGARPVVGPRLAELGRLTDAGIFTALPGGRIVTIDARTLPPAVDEVVADDGAGDAA